MSLTNEESALANVLFSSPRFYIPLLGAGVSRAAGVPVANEITLELIRALAVTHGENCGSKRESAEAWYREKFESDPTYEELLARLYPDQGDRAAGLERFFSNPSREPSGIHRALARLALDGVVQVFVNTNFDDLMEAALREVGLSPVSISTEVEYLAHKPIGARFPTVVHIHGHWQQPASMRNTEVELANYDQWIYDVTHDAFDSRGRIIIGWSGNYDPALRKILEDRRAPLWGTYWLDRIAPTGNGKLLADLLAAQLLIDDAQVSLENVIGAVDRLRARDAPASTAPTAAPPPPLPPSPAPLAPGAARSTDDYYAALRALAGAVRSIEASPAVTTKVFRVPDPEAEGTVRQAEIAAVAAPAAVVMMELGLFAPTEDTRRWLPTASLLARGPGAVHGSGHLIAVARLPGVLLLAAAAVGASARNDPALLALVLNDVRVPNLRTNTEIPLVAHDDLDSLFSHQYGFSVIYEYLKELAVSSGLLSPGQFEEAWGRVEVAWSLVVVAHAGFLPRWYPHGAVTGQSGAYVAQARPWLADEYSLDTADSSELLRHDQPALVAKYDRLYRDMAQRAAQALRRDGGVDYPASDWQIDMREPYAVPAQVRESLMMALATRARGGSGFASEGVAMGGEGRSRRDSLRISILSTLDEFRRDLARTGQFGQLDVDGLATEHGVTVEFVQDELTDMEFSGLVDDSRIRTFGNSAREGNCEITPLGRDELLRLRPELGDA